MLRLDSIQMRCHNPLPLRNIPHHPQLRRVPATNLHHLRTPIRKPKPSPHVHRRRNLPRIAVGGRFRSVAGSGSGFEPMSISVYGCFG